ncbi:MAG: FkbM family methyltransferase [Terracidiphilus sp.]
MAYALSLRRYARMAKRAVRLLRGQDAQYRLDVRPGKRHIGSIYGGWTIIPDLLKSSSVVYSIGVGNDISFDRELIRSFGLTVHGFDPSPTAIDWVASQHTPANYVFHPWGLGPADGSADFFAPANGGMYSLDKKHIQGASVQTQVTVYRLSTIADKLGTKAIDLLKIDIEGAEYDLLRDIVESSVPIRQLMIEFHHRIGVRPLAATVKSVQQLKDAGFQLFHVSETSSEFSFIHGVQSERASTT